MQTYLSDLPGSVDNLQRNLDCYTIAYQSLDAPALAEKAQDWSFFHEAIQKHTSWHGLYMGGLAGELRGKRVLELGFGNGLNALFMARLGARVTAFEIVKDSVDVLRQASCELGLEIDAIHGDIVDFDLPPFDLVIGKAFLHHLDHAQERKCLEKCASLLTPQGEARFVEPAVNSQIIDQMRWLVPMPGRPSRLQTQRFAEWKAQDPHPQRDNSSRHFEEVCSRYFSEVRVTPYGGIERLRRFFLGRTASETFAAWALRSEPKLLPKSIRRVIARTQTIVCSRPLTNVTGNR